MIHLPPPAAPPSPPSRDANRVFELVLALVCALPLLWPSDAPWINDEPRIFTHAYEANASHRLAAVGLEGTHGVRYGPVPTWIYQAFLVVTRDLRVIEIWRAAAVTAVTALALLLIAGAASLWRWYVPVVMLSPYLWLYSRSLWDNSFAVPLSALAVAAYAWFLARRAAWALLIAVACAVILPLIHLMALALVGPVVLHALVFEHRALWRHRFGVLIVAAAPLIMAWPYLRYSAEALSHAPPSTWDATAWSFPLLGGRYLSAFGLDYFFGSDWRRAGPLPAPVLDFTWALSGVAYGLVWGGAVIAAVRVIEAARRREASVSIHMGGLVLLIVIAQCVLDGCTGASFHPHYYNATWIAFAVLAWIAVDALVTVAWLRWIPAAQAVALATVLLSLIARIHLNGGTREEDYGPTLGNQLEVAAALGRFPPGTPFTVDVKHYKKFPHALQTLWLLSPYKGPTVPRPKGRLHIVYASPDPRDGHIALVEK